MVSAANPVWVNFENTNSMPQVQSLVSLNIFTFIALHSEDEEEKKNQ